MHWGGGDRDCVLHILRAIHPIRLRVGAVARYTWQAIERVCRVQLGGRVKRAVCVTGSGIARVCCVQRMRGMSADG